MNLLNIIRSNVFLIVSAFTLVACGGGESPTDKTKPNTTPVISGSPATTVVEESSYSFIPNASDQDGDVMTFAITNKPAWANFSSLTGKLSGTPTGNDVGTTSDIVIEVSDGKAERSLSPFSLQVMSKPVSGGKFSVANSEYSITEGDSVVITITRSNSVGTATVSYKTNNISAMSESDFSGKLTTPITFSDGQSSRTVTIQSIDDQVYENTETFEVLLSSPSAGYSIVSDSAVVTILDNDIKPNTAPTISGTPATSVFDNAAYLFTPTANDADNDTLTFTISNAPSWSTFSITTGTLSGTPTTSDIGTTTAIVISVNDGKATVSLAAFNITVKSSNTAPTINGTPATEVNDNVAYLFTPTANDADNDTLTFTIMNAPSWSSFNTTTGALSGTPATSDVGTTSGIVISVSDGTTTVSLAAFAITVNKSNTAPTISGTPATEVFENAAYLFSPTASDVDNDSLTFTITNAPSWSTFNTTTGLLYGTPATSDVGTTTAIVISVSDGKATVSLPAFDLTVKSSNTAPIISGTPATSVIESAAYLFIPTASDVDNDSLTFTITNAPSWSTFDSTTGTLSGTPASTDIGITSGIVISVSDGKAIVSLPAFSITVNNSTPSTGSAAFTWTIPTLKQNGDALDNLAGFIIYYGTTSGVYPDKIVINDATATSAVINNLKLNWKYYFTLTSFNTENDESEKSPEVSKLITN